MNPDPAADPLVPRATASPHTTPQPRRRRAGGASLWPYRHLIVTQQARHQGFVGTLRTFTPQFPAQNHASHGVNLRPVTLP